MTKKKLTIAAEGAVMRSSSEEGSYLRLVDFRISQL